MTRKLPPPRSLLDGLLETIPTPVVAADLKGQILLFNEAAEAALGYSSAEARHDLLVQDLFVNVNDMHSALESLRARPDQRLSARRTRLRARDGESVPTRLTARWLVEDSGVIMGWLLVFQDRRELTELTHRLTKATDRLVASEKRTTTMEFANSATHHLNQPLTSIMGNIELLTIRRDLPPDVRRRINQIYDHLERMARAVRELAQIQKHRGAPYSDDTSILDPSQD